MMRVISCKTDYMGSHIYFVVEGMDAILIDPVDKELVERVVEEEGLIVSHIILTHEHCDHSYGSSSVREQYQCKIYASSACSNNLMNERKNQSRYYEAFTTLQLKLSCDQNKKVMPFSMEADVVFCGELCYEWHGHNIFMKETPGHSEGSICILIDDSILFSGDSLMWNELVNTRFPGGSSKAYEKITLPWLKSLSPDVHVYPGHLEEFRLGDRMLHPII